MENKLGKSLGYIAATAGVPGSLALLFNPAAAPGAFCVGLAAGVAIQGAKHGFHFAASRLYSEKEPVPEGSDNASAADANITSGKEPPVTARPTPPPPV